VSLPDLWFVVIAFFWSGYFLLEGFDFGVGMLLPFLPRDEDEREQMLRSIGPVWDGNETWLVVAGGATFAAFPAWYATMFSGFYLAFLLLLVCLIVRVLSFEWRSKRESRGWRSGWMWANTLGSLGASFIWGVGLSSLLYGLPIDSDHVYTGGLIDLFNWYTILGGIAVVLVFAAHGAGFLTLKVDGDLRTRAVRTAQRLSVVAFVGGGAYLAATVAVANDRNDRPVAAPLLPALIGAIALLAATILSRRSPGWSFAATGIAAIAIVATLFTGLFPRVMVSSTDFANSLTVANTASAHYTLAVMTVVAAIFLPLVLVYQGWTYHVFRQRLGSAPVPTAAPPTEEPAL
jgi:cytochrome d ubiquinol oxidase subunit II